MLLPQEFIPDGGTPTGECAVDGVPPVHHHSIRQQSEILIAYPSVQSGGK